MRAGVARVGIGDRGRCSTASGNRGVMWFQVGLPRQVVTGLAVGYHARGLPPAAGENPPLRAFRAHEGANVAW